MCSVSLPHGVMRWSAMCHCGISWSLTFIFWIFYIWLLLLQSRIMFKTCLQMYRFQNMKYVQNAQGSNLKHVQKCTGSQNMKNVQYCTGFKKWNTCKMTGFKIWNMGKKCTGFKIWNMCKNVQGAYFVNFSRTYTFKKEQRNALKKPFFVLMIYNKSRGRRSLMKSHIISNFRVKA